MNILFRIGGLLKPHHRRVFLAVLLLLALTIVDMTFPKVIQQVVDQGLSKGESSFLALAALVLLGLGLARWVLVFSERYNTENIANRIANDLRNQLFNHIQYLPFAYHDHVQSGQLISRSIEDVRSVQGFASRGLVELIRMILLVTGIVTILFTSHAQLAWIALLPLIPLALVAADFGRRIGKLFLTVDNILGELSSRLQENVSGVQMVRAFAREPHEMARFDEVNRTLFNAQVNVVNNYSRVMPTTNLLISLGTILILWFGGPMVLRGELSLGELVAFNSYMLLLAAPAQQLTWLVNAGGEAWAGITRILEVLDTEPAIKTPVQAVKLGRLEGQVDFEAVSLNYDGDDSQALKDIDLHVHPNQVIALIGLTGSGKTTLVNLIPRFYDASSGAVKVDGVDIRQANLSSLRRQIGSVLQTSLLFSASIRDNIAYGRPEASLEEIQIASRSAQAEEFILQMPNGYDTMIGERGVTLSGGQRQRIAIARALLIDPRILILDDSTSSVDSQTEQLIQKALRTLMQGRTTFVVAQRLSTVRRADLILVMQDGRIVQRGTHAQLLEEGGLYREIYDLQLRDQEDFQTQMEQIHG